MASMLTIFAGSANPDLSANVADELRIPLAPCLLPEFPDGELQVDLPHSVYGHDVYIVQATSPPVERHLVELVLIADACHRAGAERVTAVVPYFGYARQDRRASPRQALGGRVVADMMQSGAIRRLIAVDLHTAAIEGFFGIPVEHISAVPILADAARSAVHEQSIVVAPDLGAVRLAEHYARLLELPMAIVHKTRVSGQEVSVRQIVGDVRDRSPIIVDDMLSTGATVVAAINALLAAGARRATTVVATHGLFVGRADEALLPLELQAVITTDSVTQHRNRLPMEVRTLGPLLAEVVHRLHIGAPLDGIHDMVRYRAQEAPAR